MTANTAGAGGTAWGTAYYQPRFRINILTYMNQGYKGTQSATQNPKFECNQYDLEFKLHTSNKMELRIDKSQMTSGYTLFKPEDMNPNWVDSTGKWDKNDYVHF